MSSAPPQLIADRYRLVEPLGQGGMGRVWKARDEVLHRDVAIKELVPPPGLTEGERREMRERSLREARAIARLNHANVVRVFDVLRTDGDPWIVMEYVPSRSLQEVLASDGPVPPARAAEIGLGVLGALRAAHRSGVMHRDVKPGNVLLGDDGRVVLTDFGLATVPGDPNVTRTGLVLGSPAFIAPERAKDGTAGPEGDLWSLGVTLYAAVEGQSPFARPSAIATLAALATEPPPPARRAGQLKGVLNGLLRKDPTTRINAEVAERLLRRAAGRRSRPGLSMLDGVRRPSPLGPREPRTRIVPAPQTSQDQPSAAPALPPTAPPPPVIPPAAKTAKLTVSPSPAAETAKLTPSSPSAAETAKLTASSTPAAETAKLAAPRPSDAVPPPRSEPEVPPEVPPVVPSPASPTVAVPIPTSVTDRGTDPGGEPGPDPGSTAEHVSESTVEGTSASESTTAAAADPAPTEVVAPGPSVAGRAPVSAGRDITGDEEAGNGNTGGGPLGTLLAGNRRAWLIGGLVGLLLLALVVIVPLANRDPGGETGAQRGNAPTTQPAATPPAAATTAPPTAAATSAGPAQPPATPTGLPAPTVPDGWRLHTDPTGFSVPVPSNWTVSRDASGRVKFNAPGSSRLLMIDQTDTPQPDPVADWTAQEKNRKGGYTDYQRVTISKVDYWLTAADWEWLHTEGGIRMHVRNRGFVTAKDKAYAIRWDTSAAEWEQNLAAFQTIAEGFRPARG